MAQPIFANNLWCTLAADATAAQLTLSLTAGQGARFPTIAAGNWLYVTLCDANNDIEIVKVTARTTDTITVVRGQDTTAPRAWTTGSRLEARFNIAYLQEMKNYVKNTLDAGGFTMTGFLTLARDPVSNQMLATKRYIDNTFLSKTVNYQTPIGFPMVQNWTGNLISMQWTGQNVLIVDSTNVGFMWTSTNLNLANYANAGSQCPWNTGIWESGALFRIHSTTSFSPTVFDNVSPWVMEGARSDGGNVLYIRSVYLRNQ